MSADLVSVFVYGTLLFPEVTDALRVCYGSSVSPVREPARLTNYTRLTVKLANRANFPAIVKSSGDVVDGQLIRGIDAETLKSLDDFEAVSEGCYVRSWVKVELSDRSAIDALAYICGPALEDDLEGPWDPQAFQRDDLDWYVNRILRSRSPQ